MWRPLFLIQENNFLRIHFTLFKFSTWIYRNICSFVAACDLSVAHGVDAIILFIQMCEHLFEQSRLLNLLRSILFMFESLA